LVGLAPSILKSRPGRLHYFGVKFDRYKKIAGIHLIFVDEVFSPEVYVAYSYNIPPIIIRTVEGQILVHSAGSSSNKHLYNKNCYRNERDYFLPYFFFIAV
jgi:hypothetical protein